MSKFSAADVMANAPRPARMRFDVGPFPLDSPHRTSRFLIGSEQDYVYIYWLCGNRNCSQSIALYLWEHDAVFLERGFVWSKKQRKYLHTPWDSPYPRTYRSRGGTFARYRRKQKNNTEPLPTSRGRELQTQRQAAYMAEIEALPGDYLLP